MFGEVFWIFNFSWKWIYTWFATPWKLGKTTKINKKMQKTLENPENPENRNFQDLFWIIVRIEVKWAPKTNCNFVVMCLAKFFGFLIFRENLCIYGFIEVEKWVKTRKIDVLNMRYLKSAVLGTKYHEKMNFKFFFGNLILELHFGTGFD